MSGFVIRLSGAVALLAVLLAAPLAAAAQTATPWGESIVLGPDLPTSWFPEIHADASGNVFAVWETTFPQGDADPHSHGASGAAIMLAVHGPNGWSAPADIFVKDIYNAARPIVHSDGRYLHIIFRYSPEEIGLQTLSGIYHMRAPLSADVLNAQSWSRPRRLSINAAYWAQIASLPDGVLVATYNEAVESTVDGKNVTRASLVSRRSGDYGESWESPVSISGGQSPVARSSLTAVPGSSSFIVAWDYGYDNLSAIGDPAGFGTAVSEDSGRSWSHHSDVSANTEQATVSSNGTQALLVYRSTTVDTLYFRTSQDNGRTWSDEQRISNAVPREYSNKHHFDKLSLVVDGSGRFLLGYVGADDVTESDLAVFITTFDGATWSGPEPAARVEGFPEYPRLTVSSGNQLFLLLFVRDALFDGDGQYVIWTTSRVTDAQPVETRSFDLPPIPQAEPAFEGNPLVIDPHPTVPAAPEMDSTLSSPSTTPQAALTQPIVMALLLTAGLVVLVVVAATAVRALLNNYV